MNISLKAQDVAAQLGFGIKLIATLTTHLPYLEEEPGVAHVITDRGDTNQKMAAIEVQVVARIVHKPLFLSLRSVSPVYLP